MFDEDSPSARCTSIMGSGFFGSAIVLLICCYAACSDKVSVYAQRAVVYVDGYSSNYEFGGSDGTGSGNVFRGPIHSREVGVFLIPNFYPSSVLQGSRSHPFIVQRIVIERNCQIGIIPGAVPGCATMPSWVCRLFLLLLRQYLPG